MDGAVTVKSYSEPAWNDKELLRYAGLKQINAELEAVLAECKREAEDRLSYKVCYKELPVSVCGDEVDLTFRKVRSHSLAKNLEGCRTAVLFACTVGVEMDRLISRASALSALKGLIMHAVGVERVESLADTFNEEIRVGRLACGMRLKPRFSPGYGDLDISFQRDILELLGAGKSIGLTLNANMLMSPSKSVSAIIGITDVGTQTEREKDCDACSKKDCEFRR